MVYLYTPPRYKRPIAYIEVPRRLTVPIKIGYKPSSSRVKVINKSRPWKTRKFITSSSHYQSLPSKQSVDPCWKKPTRISVLSRWDKLNLALTTLKSGQESAVKSEQPVRRGAVVHLLRKLTLLERDRGSEHSKGSKLLKKQNKIKQTTKKKKLQQPQIVMKVNKLKEPLVVTKERIKDPVKIPKEHPIVTKETKQEAAKKPKETLVVLKEPKKEAAKKPKEPPVVTKKTKKEVVKKPKEPPETTTTKVKKPAELTVIREKKKARILDKLPELMENEELKKPKEHTVITDKEKSKISDNPSLVSLKEFERMPEKPPVVVMSVKVKKEKKYNKKVSAKPITNAKTVTVKRFNRKESLSYRFINCFYRVCCQIFCYLTCLMIIGLIIIVVFT